MGKTMERQRAAPDTIQRAAVTAALMIAAAGFWARALACDLCAIYTSVEQRESRTGFFAGLGEQFSDYDTEQQSGEKVPNPAGERLHSFITQLIGGYNFTPRLALQLNMPIIVRDFRRQEARGIIDGDESGIGDLSVIGSWTAYAGVTENTVTRFTLLGGLKLPSGNSRRLQEELRETEDVHSGIHGHDLALGSGSVDGIIGAQLFSITKRV
jgi:hypothetical protein